MEKPLGEVSLQQFEARMDMVLESLMVTNGYLRLILKMVQDMEHVRPRVNTHDEQLADHEQRLTLLEK